MTFVNDVIGRGIGYLWQSSGITRQRDSGPLSCEHPTPFPYSSIRRPRLRRQHAVYPRPSPLQRRKTRLFDVRCTVAGGSPTEAGPDEGVQDLPLGKHDALRDAHVTDRRPPTEP